MSGTERADDRRQRLLDAAMTLFATVPYDEVTVSDVCSLAHVSKARFYDTFADRGELAAVMYLDCVEWLWSSIRAQEPEIDSTDDVAELLADVCLRLVRDDDPHIQIIRMDLTPLPDQVTRDRLRLHVDNILDLSGPARPDLPAAHLRMQFAALIGAYRELCGSYLDLGPRSRPSLKSLRVTAKAIASACLDPGSFSSDRAASLPARPRNR